MIGIDILTPEERAEANAKAAESRRRITAARKAAGVPPVSEAIAAFCAECIYDPAAGGTWRAQVEACQSRRCPLWPYRPGATVGDLDSLAGVKLRDALARKRGEYAEAV